MNWSAILHLKCPRCYKGNMFQYPWFQIFKFARMNKRCPVCDQSFEPEPGFYFGAMYFSYAMNVAVAVVVGVLVYVLFRPNQMWVSSGIALGMSFLFLPLFFRLSRALMLHLFGGVKRSEDY